jgi:hypothetical protein
LWLGASRLEPRAELAEHASGRFELGAMQSRRQLVDPGRLLLVDRLVRGAAELGEVDRELAEGVTRLYHDRAFWALRDGRR